MVCAYVHAAASWGLGGHAPPSEIRCSEIAFESILV